MEQPARSVVLVEMNGNLGLVSGALRLVNAIAAWPASNLALLATRRACLSAARALPYVKTLPHIGFLR